MPRKIQIRRKVSDIDFSLLLKCKKLFIHLPERHDVEVKLIRVEMESHPDLFWMRCPVKSVFYRIDGTKGANHLVEAPESEIERVNGEYERWMDLNCG